MNSRQCRDLETTDFRKYERRFWTTLNKHRECRVYHSDMLTGCAYTALVLPGLESLNYRSTEDCLNAVNVTDAVRKALKALVPKDALPLIRDLRDDFKTEDLCATVLWGVGLPMKKGGELFVSEGLSTILLHLLQLHEGDSLVDLEARAAEFLVNAYAEMPINCTAISPPESTPGQVGILRLSLLDGCQQLMSAGGFLGQNDCGKYNGTVAIPALGMKSEEAIGSAAFAVLGQEALHMENQNGYSPWFIGAYARSLLKTNGTAALVVAGSQLTSKGDEVLRRKMVEEGAVHAVIALPAGLNGRTGIALNIVLFKREASTQIRFVDASDIGRRERRRIVIGPDDIKELDHRMRDDGEYSKAVTAENVRQNEYLLNPKTYLLDTNFRYAQPLSAVKKNIWRGVQLSADRQDALKADSPTNMRYLQVREIQDGSIKAGDEDAVYLKEIPDHLSKQIIPDGAIVITRKGVTETKSAVMQASDAEHILASANVIVLEVDKEKMNPYYLQAFLESSAGRKSLEALATGNSILQISPQRLEQMIVPVPPLDEQEEIAKNYKRDSDRCCELEKELQAIKEKRHLIWRDD